MGRKSTKPDKNIYQLSREAVGLSRDAAAEQMEHVSSDRIEKIDGGSLPHPDEVLAMAACYKAPALCNYYCSHECPIGIKHVPEIKIKSLSQVTLEILASLNAMDKEKNRLVEIVADGRISSLEIGDFKKIQAHLSEISMAIDSLELWMQKSVADGEIEE